MAALHNQRHGRLSKHSAERAGAVSEVRMAYKARWIHRFWLFAYNESVSINAAKRPQLRTLINQNV
jgi:hypothetical protein